jgi:hypothetical protein
MNMMEEGDEHHEFMMKKEMKIWVCIFFFQSWGRKMLIFFVRDDFHQKLICRGCKMQLSLEKWVNGQIGP